MKSIKQLKRDLNKSKKQNSFKNLQHIIDGVKNGTLTVGQPTPTKTTVYTNEEDFWNAQK